MSRLGEWFGTRKWRVLTEADGTETWYQNGEFPGPEGSGAPVTVVFTQGSFEISPPGSFMSPLGSRGRSGVLLQEVGEDGKDVEGSVLPWGHAAVRKAREEFHAIT